MAEPVFYDPRRARWKRLRRAFDITAVVVSALIIFFVFTALRDEPLPELLFSPQKRAFKALKESERAKAHERTRKAAARSRRKSKLAASQVTLNQSEGIRAGFYVPWDAASFSSLALVRPPDGHALSRLAARAHSRWSSAGRGRPDQQVLRRDRRGKMFCRSMTGSCRF